jgi:Flp pilus assembly protein TadB
MPRLLLDIFLYSLARLLLVAAIAGAIFGVVALLGIRDFPGMLALLFALVLGMPLGIWLFAPLRRRATAGIAAVDERRRAEREQLQARLHGDDSSGD